MILLLLFLISSTICSSNAQKPKPKIYVVRMRRFFYGAQSIRDAAETYNIFSRIFWSGQKMENSVNS